METIPGRDGFGGFLNETFDGTTRMILGCVCFVLFVGFGLSNCVSAFVFAKCADSLGELAYHYVRRNEVLNAAYYNRFYSVNMNTVLSVVALSFLLFCWAFSPLERRRVEGGAPSWLQRRQSVCRTLLPQGDCAGPVP
jgi:hypothetical protein